MTGLSGHILLTPEASKYTCYQKCKLQKKKIERVVFLLQISPLWSE